MPDFTVDVTGWAEGESFSDRARVTASNEDDAITAAIAELEARYSVTIEIGDCAVLAGHRYI